MNCIGPGFDFLHSSFDVISDINNDTIIVAKCLEKTCNATAHLFTQEILAPLLPTLSELAPRIQVLAGNVGGIIKKHSTVFKVCAFAFALFSTVSILWNLRQHKQLREQNEAALRNSLGNDLFERIQARCLALNEGNANTLLATFANSEHGELLNTSQALKDTPLKVNKLFFALELSMSEFDAQISHNKGDRDLRKCEIRQVFLENEKICDAQAKKKNQLIDLTGHTAVVGMLAIDYFILPLAGLKCAAEVLSTGLSLKKLKTDAGKNWLRPEIITAEKPQSDLFSKLAKESPTLFAAAAA